MGAAAGKARAEDRLAAVELVIAERRRSSDGRRRIWDAQATCTNKSLLAAVDDIVLLEEIHAFPAARMEGTLRAAMGFLMEEFLGLRVWDASQLEGRSGLRFAADKLSVSMGARGASSLSHAFLTGGSTTSTVRTNTTDELSLGTVDELYESQSAVLLDGDFLGELNLICPASLPVLHEISLRVIRAGYTKELLHAFSNAPCDVLDRFLSILQVGCCVETDPVISYENAEWWTTEDMIRRWILVTKLVIKALVAMQRQLHKQSSGAFDRFKDEYLMAIAKRSTSVLIRFADGFTTTRSPEKLMYVLEMYEVLGSVVVNGSAVVFTGQHAAVLAKLERALRDMIGGLVTKVRQGGDSTLAQSGTTRGVGAGVHPLTRYTMANVRSLAPHRTALDVILASTSGGATEGLSSSRDLVSKLIMCLGPNIEKISALRGAGVGGGGRRQLFLANNISFVLKHAEGVLGDAWVELRRNRVGQHVRGYVECSWAPVVACLEAGNGKHPAKILAKFNSAVEKAYDGNASYEVPDPELRAVLRTAVKEKVVSAYGAWLLKHPKLERSARYTVESLEGLLSELFEGTGAEEGRAS